MAMICIHGHKECDGCMDCYEEDNGKQLRCPVCDRRLAYDAIVYVDNATDEIIGCEKCIKSVYAEDVDSRL